MRVTRTILGLFRIKTFQIYALMGINCAYSDYFDVYCVKYLAIVPIYFGGNIYCVTFVTLNKKMRYK